MKLSLRPRTEPEVNLTSLIDVVLLLLMIRGDRDAATKAESILEALNQARDNTAPLWEVNNVNHAVERITEGAGAIRAHLADKAARQ